MINGIGIGIPFQRPMGGGIEPEYQAYLDYIEDNELGPLPDELMSLQNKFMRGIKQIGIDKFDVVRLFANETATIARLNFISPGNLTAVSVGSPSFSQYVGYVSNGNPNRVSEPVNLSALTKYTQNDCHVYGYFSSYASGVNASHGVVRTGVCFTQISTVRVPPSGDPNNNRTCTCNNSASKSWVPVSQQPAGKGICCVRYGANEFANYLDGSNKIVEDDHPSAAIPTAEFSWLCRTNFDGSTKSYIHFTNGETVSVGTLGRGLTDSEVAHLHNITEEYVESVKLL